MADESNNNPLSDDFSQDMDWQAWDEIAWELEPLWTSVIWEAFDQPLHTNLLIASIRGYLKREDDHLPYQHLQGILNSY